MKKTIKHITLAVVIATVTTGAHAAWTDTVKGYWNNACTQVKSAAQAVQAMPGAVSTWCSNRYFFAPNFHKLSAALGQLHKNEANKEECEFLSDTIRASTLPGHRKNVLVSLLKRYAQQKQSITDQERHTVVAALVDIRENERRNFKKIGAYTAAAVTGIAAVYAYKRLTARPAIPGWCA